jgi:tRNA threonylcarbamoyladenosine modification (KEOPS) complex  Pcc1 subunit
VRRLRRQVSNVEGTLITLDGEREPLDASTLRAAPEGALRWISVAMPLLAAAMLLSRVGSS